MISAWGVEHGHVSKSFIPGKGFVSATKLGTKSLKRVVKPGQYAPRTDKAMAAVKTNHDLMLKMTKEAMKNGKQKTLKNGVTRVKQRDAAGYSAYANKIGGKNGKRVYVESTDATFYMTGKQKKMLRAHEQAHLAPKKRTSWRLAQISANPAKGMREEARADMKIGQHYAKGRKLGKQTDHLVHNHSMMEIMANPKVAKPAVRLEGKLPSMYARIAASNQGRRTIHGASRGNIESSVAAGANRQSATSSAAKYSARNMRAYRQTQNKIARAGSKPPKYEGHWR